MSEYDETDPFAKPVAAPTMSPPTMKQLSKGHKERKRWYDKDGDKEQLISTTGRTVLINLKDAKVESLPDRFDPTKGNKDRWTVDLHILDGDTITERLDKDGDVVGAFDPPVVPGPGSDTAILRKYYISQTLIASQLSEVRRLNPTAPWYLAVVGKLPAQSKERNAPYVLLEFEDEDKVTAREYLAKYVVEDPF
jgi:hypothetical protein